MSAEDGSNWPVKLIVAGEPSLTGPLLERVAVGATLSTVTTVVYSVKPPSLSMIRALTVYVPLSSNVHVVEASVPARRTSQRTGRRWSS